MVVLGLPWHFTLKPEGLRPAKGIKGVEMVENLSGVLRDMNVLTPKCDIDAYMGNTGKFSMVWPSDEFEGKSQFHGHSVKWPLRGKREIEIGLNKKS